MTNMPFREFLYLEYQLERFKKEFSDLASRFGSLQVIISMVENRMSDIRRGLGKMPPETKPMTGEELIADIESNEAKRRTPIVNASKRQRRKTKT